MMIDILNLPYYKPKEWQFDIGKQYYYMSDKYYGNSDLTARQWGELLHNRLEIMDTLMACARDMKKGLEDSSIMCPNPQYEDLLARRLETDRKSLTKSRQEQFLHLKNTCPEFRGEILRYFDFPREDFELFNIFNSHFESCISICDFAHAADRIFEHYIPKYIDKIKTEKQLEALNARMNWFVTYFKVDPFLHSDLEYNGVRRFLGILGVEEKEADINNFDLKNTKDIKRCKEIYPLAKEYPLLFKGWYDRKGNIKFSPTYSNGLEKKRKEINTKLNEKSKTTSGLKRGAMKVATKLVPEKLGKVATKIEQTVANVVYHKKQLGRK